MTRPSFKAAIEWLARNDDNSWLDDDYLDGEAVPSVAALLVVSLFGVSEERVIKALRRALDREGGQ